MERIRVGGHDIMVETQKHQGSVFVKLEDITLGSDYVFELTDDVAIRREPTVVHGGLPRHITTLIQEEYECEDIRV